MTQLTLQFKNASIKKRLLKVIELMNGVTVVEPTPKSGLDKALEDVKSGRVYKAKDVDDLFKQILGWNILLSILANSGNPWNYVRKEDFP